VRYKTLGSFTAATSDGHLIECRVVQAMITYLLGDEEHVVPGLRSIETDGPERIQFNPVDKSLCYYDELGEQWPLTISQWHGDPIEEMQPTVPV
jgi:hypothetical protein